jgi:serralysin
LVRATAEKIEHSQQKWLPSNWPAGQSEQVYRDPGHTQQYGGGRLEVSLSVTSAAEARPCFGGERRSETVASCGNFFWVARAPRLCDGAVFGLFTYRAEESEPWVEFDFEFGGADTSRVQLNIHMEDEFRRHTSLDDTHGGALYLALGFDAAVAFHRYKIEVARGSLQFSIDERILRTLTPADLPGGIWRVGPMRNKPNRSNGPADGYTPEDELSAGWPSPASRPASRALILSWNRSLQSGVA